VSTITRSSRGSPWRYRSLIWTFAERDLKARFRGTLLGWLWSLMIPLSTVIIYTVVFSFVFRAQPPPFGNGREGIYAIWLLVGMVTYSYFSVGVGMGIPSLLASGTLLQKIYLPSYVPVIGTAIATGLQSLIEFGIVAVILIALLNVSWTWLLAPVLLAVYFVFVLAVTLSLAVLNVYARDLQQIMAVLIQLLFFLSPVIYPMTLVPEEWHGLPVRAILELNPLAAFIDSLRAVLYDLTLPDAGQIVAILAWTAGAALVAWWVYLRKGQDIGEAI
jgi:ABC-type polysaccharide/polyol phosphate export permease